MAAAAPNPSNMLLLAVLGIGAYWVFSRRAVAGTVQPAPGAAAGKNQLSAIVSAATSLIGSLTGKNSGAANLYGTYDGRASQAWDTTPYGSSGPAYNNPSAYVAPSLDLDAVNPSPTIDWDNFWQTDTGDLGAYL